MRLEAFKLKRPAILTETRTFTDPLQPDAELTLSLAADPGRAAQTKREELADKYAREYLPVSEEEAAAAAKAGLAPRVPRYVAGAGGTAALITRPLCSEIAALLEMQGVYATGRDLTSEQAPYSFEELVVISERMPAAFLESVRFAGQLLLKAEGRRASGEVPGESTESPSGSPSNATTSGTPN